jgi:spore coat protein U-like protein
VLVIGCGGNKIYNKHKHTGADTVDMQLYMNPSVVAIWGWSQNNNTISKN